MVGEALLPLLEVLTPQLLSEAAAALAEAQVRAGGR
jgi:hypothetical protein